MCISCNQKSKAEISLSSYTYDFGTIGYMTRNDDNNIRIGDTYELFYWDMDWVSLGKQIADDFNLTFHHVPQNALLLLRDLTRGTDERIFLYKDTKQLWY